MITLTCYIHVLLFIASRNSRYNVKVLEHQRGNEIGIHDLSLKKSESLVLYFKSFRKTSLDYGIAQFDQF